MVLGKGICKLRNICASSVKRPDRPDSNRPPSRPRKEFTKRPPADQLYGLHGIREALNAEKQLDKVLVDKDVVNPQMQALVARLREQKVPIQFVPKDAIERQAPGRNHQGIIGYLPAVTYHELSAILPGIFKSGVPPLLILLDGVTDVRNLGAIARSTEVLGGHAMLLPAQGSARVNADAVKTSAGALQHLPVCRVELVKQAVAELQASGVQVVGLTEKTDQPLTQVDLTGPTCLLLGDEGVGIQPAVLKACDALASIPMKGKINSLNVSVAAGVALYEVARQRSIS